MFPTIIPYNEPFYDIVEHNWGLLEDDGDPELYWKLDDIYRHFTESKYAVPDWADGMTDNELAKYYDENLPKLMASALRKYADQLENGDFEFVTDWNWDRNER